MPRKHKQSLEDWTADIADRISKKNPNAAANSTLPYREPPTAIADLANTLTNLLADMQKKDPDKFPAHLEDILSAAFIWSNCPQGVDFWLDICQKLRDWRHP